MIREIVINNKKVAYRIERKSVKNINIRVKNDGIVYISANRRVSEKYILSVLSQKSDFIFNALKKLEYNEKLIKMESEENAVKYLGKKYEINIIPSDKETACLEEDYFYIYTRFPENKENIKSIVKNWHRKQCINIFNEISQKVRSDFLEKGIFVPETVITVKEMKTRWGSCNPSRGRMSINLKLVEYPKECIAEVFYHEYAHYIHPDHSADFYNLLFKMYPDYKKWKSVLECVHID